MPASNRRHHRKRAQGGKGLEPNAGSSTNESIPALSQSADAALVISKMNEEAVTSRKPSGPWTPSSYTAYKALLSARLCAAIWSVISDCDETYNYWEPTHFLIYKTGFQTWEYSPVYAIRSYAYIWLHALPGYLYSLLLQSNKVLVFFFLRCLLGVGCALCEVYFYRGICSHYGAHAGRLTLTFLLVGAGMFVSSAAYLPSSFSMYMVLLLSGAWFVQDFAVAIVATAVGVIVGWPFTALIGLPLACDILFFRRKYKLFIKWSLLSLLFVLVPVVLIDSIYYGRLVIAPLNIVLYNVFTDHGPDLYGVEPWTYYFVNGFLNFNIVFPAALISLPMVIITKYITKQSEKHTYPPKWLFLLGMYGWILVFFLQPHKEERFLFPIYPMLCLAGAFTVDCIQKLFFHIFIKKKMSHYLNMTNWIAIMWIVIFSLLSISRSVAIYKGYHSSLDIYTEIEQINQDMDAKTTKDGINLCVGKEWYRFPSNFFLPANWKFQFIKSEFRGQLPKPYSNLPNATMIIPTHMNDMNKEEPSRYISIHQCDYLIDTDYPEESEFEPRYAKNKDMWEVVASYPFLDTKRSPSLLRAFYVPWFSDQYCHFVDYNLLKRISPRNAHRRTHK